ncbi:MAG: hypothetical protein AAF211_07705 [Myxococcota bacterium]
MHEGRERVGSLRGERDVAQRHVDEPIHAFAFGGSQLGEERAGGGLPDRHHEVVAVFDVAVQGVRAHPQRRRELPQRPLLPAVRLDEGQGVGAEAFDVDALGVGHDQSYPVTRPSAGRSA